MSKQLILASGVQILLMIATFLLLSSGGAKAIYRWAGSLLLGLTFCWSIILGCVLALQQISMRI